MNLYPEVAIYLLGGELSSDSLEISPQPVLTVDEKFV